MAILSTFYHLNFSTSEIKNSLWFLNVTSISSSKPTQKIQNINKNCISSKPTSPHSFTQIAHAISTLSYCPYQTKFEHVLILKMHLWPCPQRTHCQGGIQTLWTSKHNKVSQTLVTICSEYRWSTREWRVHFIWWKKDVFQIYKAWDSWVVGLHWGHCKGRAKDECIPLLSPSNTYRA